MKVREGFLRVAMLMLLLGVSTSFAQEYEDVVYLKDGGVRRGMILEQVPGESVKLKTTYGEVFVIEMSEIAKMAKEEKATSVVSSREESGLKLEGWYTYWGLGSSSNTYTDDMDGFVGWEGDDSFSMGFDFFGFYWPLQNQQTILGIVYNASADRRTYPGYSADWEQWISGQWSISAMHFLQSGIGKGPFVRGDLGWGSISAVNDDGDTLDDSLEDGASTSGPAALFGIGYGLPLGAGGTRLLFNLNYALRPGIGDAEFYDYRYDIYREDSKGGVRVFSITVGALF